MSAGTEEVTFLKLKLIEGKPFFTVTNSPPGGQHHTPLGAFHHDAVS